MLLYTLSVLSAYALMEYYKEFCVSVTQPSQDLIFSTNPLCTPSSKITASATSTLLSKSFPKAAAEEWLLAG